MNDTPWSAIKCPIFSFLSVHQYMFHFTFTIFAKWTLHSINSLHSHFIIKSIHKVNPTFHQLFYPLYYLIKLNNFLKFVPVKYETSNGGWREYKIILFTTLAQGESKLHCNIAIFKCECTRLFQLQLLHR